METFMTDALTRRRKGFIRSGRVKLMPIRRTSDWLPENSDSAFMNTGAKVEYVVPRLQRSGQLIDPLADLTDEQKDKVARELGMNNGTDLSVMKEEKSNYWINRAVILDKNGMFLNLSNVGDFITYKILEVNLEYIAPSYEERYMKGTYKFALVFEEEEEKIKNLKIDVKKEAYMMFGKIDGSVKKLSDFLWIYYLTDKEGKRLPNNPSLEYLRGEVGRLIDERPGEFLSIMTDNNFETKALIQRSINIGLIQRDGMTFKVFGEDSSKNTLDGLISFLLDERNNNIRLSLIGKIEAAEQPSVYQKPTEKEKEEVASRADNSNVLERLKIIEEATKKAIEENVDLKAQNKELLDQIEKLTNKKPAGRKPKEE